MGEVEAMNMGVERDAVKISAAEDVEYLGTAFAVQRMRKHTVAEARGDDPFQASCTHPRGGIWQIFDLGPGPSVQVENMHIC
jgi:hypothetical protein